MPSSLSRRRFLKTTAAAGLTGFWTGVGRADDKKPSPNDRLHVGVIGVAGQGAHDLGEVARAGAEIVALCDVDESRTGRARETFPKATFHADFRKLLDQKGIDAVVV